MYVGFFLFSLGFAITAFSNQLLVLFIATIIYSVGELLYVPTRQTILADLVDESHRGSYVAFNGIIYQVGKIIASVSLMFSPTMGKYGMAALLLLFGLLAIILTKRALAISPIKKSQVLFDD